MSSKPFSNKCTPAKNEECKKKSKECNPTTGRCISKTGVTYKKSLKENKTKTQPKDEIKEHKTPSPVQNQEEIKTTKTIHDFIKELKKYKTAKEAIENIFKDDDEADSIIKELKEKDKKNTKSRQGFIYELLWDICIKFNITNFTNRHTEHGIGNFNIFSNFVEIKDYINKYLNQGYISGNSGGYSDITFRTKQEETDMNYDLNLVSVKYRKGDDIKHYDIQNLCPLIKDREDDNYNSINTLLFVKDKEHFKKICKSANQSSNVLIKYISPHGNYENVYDLQDLEKHYSKLWKILDDFNFLKDVDDFKENYLQIYKKKFIPRFHQELFIEKITSLIKKEQKKILVGAIPRSGKTYIMAGTILKDVEDAKGADKKSKTKFNNYLIITPAPNETLKQYYEAFDDYYDFKNNKIVPINVKDVEIGKEDEKIEFKGEEGKHNVFLISKQRLGFRDRQDNDKKDNEIYNEDYIKKIKANIIKYFGDNKFKFIFFDEAHFGMSTRIAQNIFKELDINNKSYKIYVTATYNKPKQIYNVDNNNIIKWDLQDIRLIKNIKNERTFNEAYENLEIKFGRKILLNVLKKNNFNIINNKNYILDNIKNKEINNIIQQYKHFPEPILLTSVWDKDFVDSEIKKIGENETFGFDMHKLFMPQTNKKFKNEEQLIQLLEYYFGYYITDKDSERKKNNFYENKNEYKKRGILPNIENICLNNCRTLQPEHKTTQLWFLPPYEISKITKSLIELLKEKFNYIFNNYMFYVAVEGVKGQKTYDNVTYLQKPADIKKEIEKIEKDLYTNTEYSKYEGLIILAGSRLQLGISLKNVDIVALFTHITASDAIYQMIFRSMTEIEDDIECDGKSYCGRKKYGFMVDLNPQRTLFTIDYLTDMYLDNDKFQGQNREKKMELIADLINIDKHKFIDRYNREDKKSYKKYVKEFFGKLYKAWDAKTENIQRLLLDKNLFDRNIFKPGYDIKELFTEIEKEKKQQKHKIDKPDNEVQKGNIKKTIYDIIKPEKGKKNPNSDELWAYLFAEIISILSLITSYTDKDGNACIFNLENKDNFLYELKQIIENVIDKDDDIKNILLYTLKKRIIIKDSIEDNQLYNMINNAIDNMEEKQRGGNLLELNKQIQLRKSQIYSIKEPDELLKYINDNLKPKQVEKGERGEVFTPMTLVNEMLDTLPKEVWKNPNLKWLDPSAGMGNFPVAVYMRLMEGLKDVKGYKNEEERRKHILKNMLYMVELDKTNVFMMKKIFCGKLSKSSKKGYELNIFEGSFIDGKYEKIYKTDIKFDIIMGNPPYNQGGISSKKKIEIEEDKKEKKTIWPDFIEKSFTILKTSGYLLFVNPLSWVKNTHKLHKVMFEKYIIYLELWDVNNGKKLINGELPISIFLLQNIKNTNNNKTIIKVKNDRYNYYDDFEEYLDKDLSLPLGYIDKLLKLRRFIINNNCSLEYKTTKSNDITLEKNEKKKLNQLKYMSIDDIKKIKETDKYCIDTYDLRDKQYQLNITKSYHPDYNKKKLILSHKSELEGIFIDSGKLGICGTHNYYILGNNLTLIKKILSFDIIKKAGIFTKYGQNFLDTDFFTYVPDLRKLGYTNITEDEFNKLIGISFIKKSKSGNKSISLPKKHKSKKSHKRNKSI
jgi:hypothetical protein